MFQNDQNCRLASQSRVVKSVNLFPFQVDLLKLTALPLMKKFGIDGEGFEIKVRTTSSPIQYEFIFLFIFLNYC